MGTVYALRRSDVVRRVPSTDTHPKLRLGDRLTTRIRRFFNAQR